VLNVKKNNKQKDSLHGRPQTLKEIIENQKLKHWVGFAVAGVYIM